MKIFPVHDDTQRQLDALLHEVKHMRNGDTSRLIEASGASYRLNYGVMLVHLREMAGRYAKDNELARRLWFREVRETMILATLLAQPGELSNEELNTWGPMISSVELAEQVALNVLGKRPQSDALLEEWLHSPNYLITWSALMAIGWQFRFLGNQAFADFSKRTDHLALLARNSSLVRPMGHALRMAARFSKKDCSWVKPAMLQWQASANTNVRQVAGEVLFEIEWQQD